MLLFSWEESPQIIRVRIKAAVLSFVVFFFKATVSLYMNESGACVCWDQKGLDTDTLSWPGSAYSSLRRNLRIMLWRAGGGAFGLHRVYSGHVANAAAASVLCQLLHLMHSTTVQEEHL